jgi:hypothetical protein
MNLTEVIDNLYAAKEGSRQLDAYIAHALGWRQTRDQYVDPSSGETRTRRLWVVPSTEEHGKVPFYTTNLQEALDLAEQVAPGNVGACSWEGGKAKARLGMNGSVVNAATPALALCIAALRTRAGLDT